MPLDNFLAGLAIAAGAFLVLWPAAFGFAWSALRKRASAVREAWQERGWLDLDGFSDALAHGGSLLHSTAFWTNHPEATPAMVNESLAAVPHAWVSRSRLPMALSSLSHGMLLLASAFVYRFGNESAGWVMLVTASVLMLPLLALVLRLAFLPQSP